MNQCTKPMQKVINKSDNFCFCKVGKEIFNNKKSTAYKELKINLHFGVVAIIFSPTVLTIMINDSTVSRYFSKENERISSQCTTVQ